MTIRVVHFGTGPTGVAALHGILGHPELELVGLGVARPDNVGRDAGELCGLAPVGIRATRDTDALLAIDADCVSYFGDGVTRQAEALADIARFLRGGRDVVTTSIASLVLPAWAPEAQRQLIADACKQGSSTCFATGIEPGFASDLLPVALLSLVDELDCVRVQEIADYSRYPVAAVMRDYFGFGCPIDQPVPLFQGDGLLATWSGVVHHLAAEVGATLDDVRLVHEVAPTERDLETAFGTVRAGSIGGVRFEVQGMLGGRPLAVLEHVNRVGRDVAPHWPRAKDGDHTSYRILVDGRPALRCELDLDHVAGVDHGLIATAMRAINVIPAVHAAAPGMLGPLDLPHCPARNVRARGRR